MRALSWGMSGDDVVQLQRALQVAGYYTGRIDSYFGFRTKNAVSAFQRARGFPPDGIADGATLRALSTVGSGSAASSGSGATASGTATAISIHIGLNRVDPARYAGWSGQLDGCENDAGTIASIARAENFSAEEVLTSNATVSRVLTLIADAARSLKSGDFFFISFACHGGQVPVPSASTGTSSEEDGQDETLCLYDGMLLDNQLWESWAAFRSGVNIIMTVDACHSGSVYRLLPPSAQSEYAAIKSSFYQNLGFSRTDGPGSYIPHPVGLVREWSKTAGRETAGGVRTRNMPWEINQHMIAQNQELYRSIWRKTQSRGSVLANGLSLSACSDSQLSQEINGAGVFTTQVKETWANNSFAGTYDEFHREIVGRMGANQTPQLNVFGGNPQSIAQRIPFNTR